MQKMCNKTDAERINTTKFKLVKYKAISASSPPPYKHYLDNCWMLGWLLFLFPVIER